VIDFKLKRPCAHCPFRTDVPGYLRRAEQIAHDLAEGAPFICHETTVPDPDDESENTVGERSQFCAGALIAMEKSGHANQTMRIDERVGAYDPTALDLGAPVVASLFDFVEHHRAEDEPEIEPCCVSDPGCEAPAGMLVGGMAVPVEPTGETHDCPDCGQPVCDACSDDRGVCDYCADEAVA